MTEESYTSIASFLDGDNLPNYGEKPNDWKPSGKRIKRCSAVLGVPPMSDCIKKRGLYRTGNNWCINADCKVAANIIKKVSRKLSLDLRRLCRGTLTCPQRVYLWSARKKRSNMDLSVLRSINLESP
ncbi:hypothetical protein [Okeania sp. SIO3B5]|uniref:hypothetical protein n=1 Tax=Okeania sp. SIO3B5 TaxID=2607811 RepID=UPI0025D1B9BB|nr:hypothetical protein [Okeania sp. SIO3B5]